MISLTWIPKAAHKPYNILVAYMSGAPVLSLRERLKLDEFIERLYTGPQIGYTCYNIFPGTSVVRGLTINVLNTSVDQFLNIPYAEPPVRDLRFTKPQPLKAPKKDIIDGTKPGNSCMQIPEPETENSRSPTESPLKAVMFWIYGGGLSSGSIFDTQYNGSILATYDVVFVSANYRLGPFGYLYGGDVSAPGNMGFFDQLLALKWVRENIHVFGGDRNLITIFGESAGSWSVSAHIISPLTRGLFKRAIMQSGAHMYSKDRDVISKSEALTKAKHMAQQLNCSDADDWLRCLRGVGAHEFLNFETSLTFPVLGTEYLTLSAQQAFMDNKFNSDIDLMAGINRDEGSDLLEAITPTHIDNMTVEDFTNNVLKIDKIYHGINTESVSDFYLRGVNVSNPGALRWALYDFFGDLFMKCPTYLFAKQLTTMVQMRQNVYFYELTYENPLLAKEFGCDPITMGICHGMDLLFVFGIPFTVEKQWAPEDYLL
ncbi:unnamed protein product, partial [Oppiella nova]